jgi:hypothetical protein
MIYLQALNSTMASNRKIARIESAIYLLRGQRVMLDSDLAAIYGVTTRRLNEQLKRNRSRFPQDFAFQLTAEEFTNLKSQFATSSSHGGKRKPPWVFTEHGAIMLGRARSPSAPQRTAQRSVPTKRREIGFHVREKTARYRVHSSRSKFENRLPRRRSPRRPKAGNSKMS